MPDRRKNQHPSASNADNVAAHPRKGSSTKKASLEAELLSRLNNMEQKLDQVLAVVYQNKEVSHG